MNHYEEIGCLKCPVKCTTLLYRGSSCKATRSKLGLGDPLTLFEKIKTFSLEEMATFLSCGFNHTDYEPGDYDPQIMEILTREVQ